jgi:hypothetical protein
VKRLFIGVFVTRAAPGDIQIDELVDWFDSKHEAAGAMLEAVCEKHPQGQIRSHRVDDITEIAKRGVRLGAYA